ncbi:MAG: 5-oxoprolinase subunit PxpB [Bacteroidia bacterium]|nr:5-oxoprolinase subunit PxpB [Bacteroidia bacterium]
MMTNNSYHIYPLGDSAITLDFGNVIDETITQKIIALFHSLNKKPLTGMIEAVPAYSSITIYYDVIQLKKLVPANRTVAEWMIEQFEKRVDVFQPESDSESRQIKIPVCYEKNFAVDIEDLAMAKNISVEKVIQIHTSKTYRVYMLGFLPGFAYMGEVDEQIEMPRRMQPRQKVEAGSVGIAGRQTGVYPMAMPGGWQIIGRTPLTLFEAHPNLPDGKAYEDSICLLHPGDMVQFYSISKHEFESY